MSLSIVLPAYNEEANVTSAVEQVSAVAQQLGMEYEIILVNDGSSDRTGEIGRELVARIPNFRLVEHHPNRGYGGALKAGFAAATNQGIRASGGRYVFLVNSDVLILPGCIDRLRSFMDENPRVGLSAPRILNADRTLQVSCMAFPSLRTTFCRTLALDTLFPRREAFTGLFLNPGAHERTRSVDAVSGAFWVVRREALDEVGLLDERFFMYGEDLDWCKRFHRAGWDVVYCREAEAIHFGGASSANAPVRFVVELNRAMLQYWRKHHSFAAVAAVWFLFLLGHSMRLAARCAAWVFRPSQRIRIARRIREHGTVVGWLLFPFSRRATRIPSQEGARTATALGAAERSG